MQTVCLIQWAGPFPFTCNLSKWNCLCPVCTVVVNFPFPFALIVGFWKYAALAHLLFVMLFISCWWSQVSGYNCVLTVLAAVCLHLLCLRTHTFLWRCFCGCWIAQNCYCPLVTLHCCVSSGFCCWVVTLFLEMPSNPPIIPEVFNAFKQAKYQQFQSIFRF